MRAEQIDENIMIYYDYFLIWPAPQKFSRCLMIKDMCTIMFLKWKWKRHNHMMILQIFKECDYQGRGKNETSQETLN